MGTGYTIETKRNNTLTEECFENKILTIHEKLEIQRNEYLADLCVNFELPEEAVDYVFTLSFYLGTPKFKDYKPNIDSIGLIDLVNREFNLDINQNELGEYGEVNPKHINYIRRRLETQLQYNHII